MKLTRIVPLVFVAGFALAEPDVVSVVNTLVGAVTAEVGSIVSEATSAAMSFASEATSASKNTGVVNVCPLHVSVPVLAALFTTAGGVLFGAWVAV